MMPTNSCPSKIEKIPSKSCKIWIVKGKGLGRKAFQDFVQEMFENEEIESISLTVFESNQRAKNLYHKEGFEIVQTIEIPERKYIMRKSR